MAVIVVVAGALPGAALLGLATEPASAATPTCPCSLWTAATTPSVIDSGDGSAVELGVQFSSSVSGYVTGVRFYKSAANTGIHVGTLWTSSGTQLAQATFSNESTTGWQDVTFSSPVAVAVGAVYVAGYHTNTGHYSVDAQYFTASSYTNAPLTAPGGSSSTPNGVFTYSPTPTFPANTFNGNNYWVDVDFSTSTPVAPPACASCTLWGPQVTPTTIDSGDGNAVELGVQFNAAVNGFISGVRFYKAAANTGTHIGGLWTASGSQLAQATFTSETASGWQQVSFAPPVAVTAGASYVAGYHTNTGHYSVDSGYFLTSGYTNPPLSAPGGSNANPNGLFAYSPVPTFPNGTYNGNNYWVDVVFNPAKVPVSITLGGKTLTPPAGTTEQASATETFSDASTADVTGQVTWASSNPAAATISASGLLSAVAAGTTTVSATLGGLSGSVVVTVAPPIVYLSVQPFVSPLRPGQTGQLTATARLVNGASLNVTALASWSMYSWGPATISATGLVTAVSPGLGVVTATVGRSQAIALVIVIPQLGGWGS